MTCSIAPFSEASYQLPSCFLTSLTESEAGLLSSRLATMEPWRSLGYSAEGLLHYLLRPDPALYRFVIFVGPSAKGLVCVRYPWLRGPCLELLAVLDDQQKRGIGHEIMAWIQTQCPKAAPNIWTLTSSFNSGARSFYRSLGFHEIASLPDLVRSGYDEILLRKTLE
jgi:diamine N-acetyltransferase